MNEKIPLLEMRSLRLADFNVIISLEAFGGEEKSVKNVWFQLTLLLVKFILV